MGHKAKFLLPVMILGLLALALCYLLFTQNQQLQTQQTEAQLANLEESLNWAINNQLDQEHQLVDSFIKNAGWQNMVAQSQLNNALALLHQSLRGFGVSLSGIYFQDDKSLLMSNKPQPTKSLGALAAFIADSNKETANIKYMQKNAFVSKYYFQVDQQYFTALTIRFLDEALLSPMQRLTSLQLSWQPPESLSKDQLSTEINIRSLADTKIYATKKIIIDPELTLISLIVITVMLCICIVIYFRFSNEFIDAQKQIIDKISSFGSKLPSDLDIMEWKVKPASKMVYAEKAFIGYLENIERYVNQMSLKLDKIKSEQQKLELKKKLLAQERDLALEAPKQKAEFFSKMADEITVPLNGVNSMLNLLSESHLPNEASDLVKLCKSAANNLIASVNNILDYSRLDAGRLELKRRRFSPKQLVQEVIMSYSNEAQEKGLTLEHNLASDVPESIIADKQRIHQILSNLAGNAVRFTESGEVGIYVDLKVYHNRNYLRFSVKDTGVGLDEAAQKKLFSSLTNDRSLSKASFAGRLKLIVAKRLAEAMGGKIGVNSKPGAGSRFWFTVEID